MPADRNQRRHVTAPAKSSSRDTRSPAQKDRDRILYTSAFRRLAGVTQVVGAVEGHVFHNRLTHTLEVAQIARRLAERLSSEYKSELRRHRVTLDSEVAEAAALADEHEQALQTWFGLFPRGRYVGDYLQRSALRALNARLIEDFVSDVTLSFANGKALLIVPPLREVQIRFLQNIVWTHVIESPRLASQQRGQRRIVRGLFESYRDAINDSKDAVRLVPGAFRIELEQLDARPESGAPSREARVARLAADIVASFTDSQAVSLFRRLSGVAPGSVTDLLDG